MSKQSDVYCNDGITVKRHRKPATGFFSLWLGIPCLTFRKSLRIEYSSVTGEAVSVANWVLTVMSATQCLDGRRRKNLSAVCPRNAGELLWVFKYALKRSKLCLRHPFNYRELSCSLRSYPQRPDLFFFIFIILSLFYVF